MFLPSFKWFVKEDMFIAKASPQEHGFAAGDVDGIANGCYGVCKHPTQIGIIQHSGTTTWLLRIPQKKNDELAGN